MLMLTNDSFFDFQYESIVIIIVDVEYLLNYYYYLSMKMSSNRNEHDDDDLLATMKSMIGSSIVFRHRVSIHIWTSIE